MILIPLADPILIFLLVLLTILFATLLNRVHIPQIIGLILAGMTFGSNGFGILADDQSFAMLGEVGLLYIMFQVGLDVDIHAFKLQKRQGLYFGAYTLLIPMGLGISGGMIQLGMDVSQAMLFSAMMSCHTLIAYPIVNKMGVNDNRAINIVITGTIVAVTASLLIIAGVMGIESGDGWSKFAWIACGATLFAIFVFWVLPRVAKWFFAKFSDGMCQYVFVLAAAMASAVIAEIAGLEGILGAFFAGLVLSSMLPVSAPWKRLSWTRLSPPPVNILILISDQIVKSVMKFSLLKTFQKRLTEKKYLIMSHLHLDVKIRLLLLAMVLTMLQCL